MTGRVAVLVGVVTLAAVGGAFWRSTRSEVTPAPSSAPAGKTDDQFKAEAIAGMHDSLLADLDALLQATKDMQKAAPSPKGRGWDKNEDAAAIQATKDAWVRARAAYEQIEGALAPLFPEVDRSIDGRYDDFLSESSDDYLFDDLGVTGLHAAERVLYADTTPAYVIKFERSLPGYKPAEPPRTEREADDFKNRLLTKIVADAQTLRDEWQPAKIDVAVAFHGVVSLMKEQQEKVNKASTDEEESRYANRTMADLRDNLGGTKKIYAAFRPWILARKRGVLDGVQIDHAITDGFARLDVLYGRVSGDGIPQPPATWSAESPSTSDLATPFGVLYSRVREAVDPAVRGSVVDRMSAAATLLGFPQFIESH